MRAKRPARSRQRSASYFAIAALIWSRVLRASAPLPDAFLIAWLRIFSLPPKDAVVRHLGELHAALHEVVVYSVLVIGQDPCEKLGAGDPAVFVDEFLRSGGSAL